MPSDPFWTHYHAAQALHKAGDFDGAAAEYRSALQQPGIDLFIDYARLSLCLAYRAQGKLAEALDGYRGFDRLLGKPYPAVQRSRFFYQGCLHFAVGDLRAGRAAHNKLLDLLTRPDTPRDYIPEFLHPADLEFAVQDCDRRGNRFGRALAEKARGDWPEAIADFEAACDALPDRPALRDWLHAARILQPGFPNPYNPERLLPGVEYMAFDYDEDAAAVRVTRYAAGAPTLTQTLARAEGVRLHEQLSRSRGWFLLRSQSHKEGSSHYFANVERG